MDSRNYSNEESSVFDDLKTQIGSICITLESAHTAMIKIAAAFFDVYYYIAENDRLIKQELPDDYGSLKQVTQHNMETLSLAHNNTNQPQLNAQDNKWIEKANLSAELARIDKSVVLSTPIISPSSLDIINSIIPQTMTAHSNAIKKLTTINYGIEILSEYLLSLTERDKKNQQLLSDLWLDYKKVKDLNQVYYQTINELSVKHKKVADDYKDLFRNWTIIGAGPTELALLNLQLSNEISSLKASVCSLKSDFCSEKAELTDCMQHMRQEQSDTAEKINNLDATIRKLKHTNALLTNQLKLSANEPRKNCIHGLFSKKRLLSTIDTPNLALQRERSNSI